MEYTLLKNIAEITMGQSPSSSSYNEEGVGIPFYQGNADFGELYPTARIWCNEPKKIANKNDILISVRAPIGALNYATEQCCIGRGLASITVKDEVLRNYVFRLLKASRNKLINQGSGSTFKAIGKSNLEELRIPIVDEMTQKKIMNLMDATEQIIRQRQIELQLFDDLIKARFVEMFGNTVTNPLNWEEHRLDEYIIFLTSGSRGWSQYFVDKEDELFITIKNVKNNHIILDNIQYIKAPNNKEAERTKVKDGDLLISITADLGRTGVVDSYIAEKGAYINQHLSLVRLDLNRINPLYVSYFLETESGKRQFESKNQNGVKAGLNFNAIKSLKILVPPLEVQELYLEFVTQVDKSKAVVRKALDETQLLFDSLMQEYFG